MLKFFETRPLRADDLRRHTAISTEGINETAHRDEVFKPSSRFLMCSRSNTADSLQYTAKKSVRELLVLNGSNSKNSLRAERGL